MRVFLDTNVLVAALATRGLCADVLRLVLAEHDLIIADVVLTELERVLLRKLRLSRRMVGDIIALLRRYHVEPKPKAKLNLSLADADDLWVLSSAVSANADVFVTGDRKLIGLQGQLPFAILDPRSFWEMLKKQREK